jgi:hypothetical protein
VEEPFQVCQDRDSIQYLSILKANEYNTRGHVPEVCPQRLLDISNIPVSSSIGLQLLQGVARIGEMNIFHRGIKLTESVEQSWNGKLVFFMSSDAVVPLH